MDVKGILTFKQSRELLLECEHLDRISYTHPLRSIPSRPSIWYDFYIPSILVSFPGSSYSSFLKKFLHYAHVCPSQLTPSFYFLAQDFHNICRELDIFPTLGLFSTSTSWRWEKAKSSWNDYMFLPLERWLYFPDPHTDLWKENFLFVDSRFFLKSAKRWVEFNYLMKTKLTSEERGIVNDQCTPFILVDHCIHDIFSFDGMFLSWCFWDMFLWLCL